MNPATPAPSPEGAYARLEAAARAIVSAVLGGSAEDLIDQRAHELAAALDAMPVQAHAAVRLPRKGAAYLSIDAIAARLQVAPNTFRAYVARGQAPAPDVRFGRTPGWLEATLEEWRPGFSKLNNPG